MRFTQSAYSCVIGSLAILSLLAFDQSHSAMCKMSDQEISNIRYACASNGDRLVFQIHNENRDIVVTYLDFEVAHDGYKGIVRAFPRPPVGPRQVSNYFYVPAPAPLRGKFLTSEQLQCQIKDGGRKQQGWFDCL